MATSLPQENHILRLLSFETIYSREDIVADAEEGTFSWMLEDDDQPLVLSAGSESVQGSPERGNRSPGRSTPNLADNLYQSRTTSTFGGAEVDIDDHGSKAYIIDELGSDIPTMTPTNESPPLRGRSIHILEDLVRTDVGNAFLAWLRYGNGLYRISGKAGSGKSTLMKLLSQHGRTHAELCHLAEQKRPVQVKFYFWSSGDRLQRSLEGTLLFYSIRNPQPMSRTHPQGMGPL